MDLTKKLSILVFLLCVLTSLKNQKAASDSRSVLHDPSARREEELHSDARVKERLRYDYYSESCPSAEKIIRSTVRELHEMKNTVGPALLRLAFHDCFVMGCDASILLDSDGNVKSEKEARPNRSIKGFEQIDTIKSRLEEACPGVVSCADTVALAARESVLLAGGQFYPVLTGRKDSIDAFQLNATTELPRPDDDFTKALRSFALKGFDARESVSLLGAHSTGKVHCNFIRKRLFNFTANKEPDSSINPEFLEILRAECGHQPASTPSGSPSPSSAENGSPDAASVEDRAMRMDYEGAGKGFGEVYYRSLLQGKGLLFVDQQLTSGPETKPWVETYAADVPRFRRDFGHAMFKLTHLQVAKEGQVRLNCRRLN
ncbi:putative Peroxidase 48 [Salvia miltiorrhiza]|uniref:putative Peroxidase 48 n=1 Tax=Salvia miltiorrhiza TaxID=226208 RepID=UPI0025ACFBCC|nr:putative Peroxidase 48 [Salvia miltiorrhiza]